MCLIGLALEPHARFPLVIAANRDEFLRRPAAALDWWQPAPDAAWVLGGRDLQAGGTWMGLSASGRLAMLTNVRGVLCHDSAAPSRGAIVPAWLQARQSAAGFWRDRAARGHNPFNLLAADLVQGHWWWADDRADAPREIGPGLYGLSNAALDSPWPKVQGLKRAMAQAIAGAPSSAALETLLFAALSDRTPAGDDALPDTGVGLERERWLAPAFIRTPDASYGTRCSTLLIVERGDGGLSACLIERQFDVGGQAVAQRRVRMHAWPSGLGDMPRVEPDPISAG